MKQLFLYVGLWLITVTCKPLYPELPPEKYQTPDLVKNAPISHLSIPLKMAVKDLEQQFNEELPKQLYETKQIPNIDQKIGLKIWKNGQVKLIGLGKNLEAEIPLRMRLNGNYSTKVMGLKVNSPIDQEVAIRLKIQIELNINSNWKLEPNTSLKDYVWETKPMFKLGFLKIDLSPFLDDFIRNQSPQLMQTLDETLEPYLDLKPIAKQAWKEMQTARAVSEWQGKQLYFNLQPQSLTLSDFVTQSDTLQSIIYLEAKPFAALANNKTRKTPPLPKAKIVKQLVPKFNLYVTGQVPSRLIEQEIRQQFRNETFELKGKKSARLKEVAMYGSQEKMVFDLDMEGDISGKFYVWGIPRFEERTGKLNIKEISYRSEGTIAFSKFLQRVFKGKILRQLKKAVEEPLQAQMDSIAQVTRESLQHYPISEGMVLKGNLRRFDWQQVWLSPKNTHALLYLKGDLSLIITRFVR